MTLTRERVRLDAQDFSAANKNRTPGIHLSDVIVDQMTVAGLAKYREENPVACKRCGEVHDASSWWLQGYVWENVVCGGHLGRFVPSLKPELFWRPSEIAVSLDGSRAMFVEYDASGKLLTLVPPGFVLLSPDAVVLLQPLELGEFKWTTKSANMNPELEKPEWAMQAKGYCFGLSLALRTLLGGGWLTRVQWHVQFAVGCYWGCQPVYERMRDEFTPQQLVDFWQSVRAHVEWRTTKEPSHKWAEYTEEAA